MTPLSAADHKLLDAASYDAAATAFDQLTERFATPLALEMLRLAQLGRDDRGLDVGTGTGLVALLAARAAPEGRVVGIDHSEGMLREASAKALQRGSQGSVEFRRMDAEALELSDACFDAVLSLFVLFHRPDPSAALREMQRVLRPGGRIVIGVGRGPLLASWSGLAQAVRRCAAEIAAARGRLLTAPHVLRRLMLEEGLSPPQEHVAHPATVDVPKLMRAAGFRDVATAWQGRRVELDPEAFWTVHVVLGSTERIRMAELPDERVAELKAAFLDRCRRVQARGGKLVYSYGALFCSGSA